MCFSKISPMLPHWIKSILQYLSYQLRNHFKTNFYGIAFGFFKLNYGSFRWSGTKCELRSGNNCERSISWITQNYLSFRRDEVFR